MTGLEYTRLQITNDKIATDKIINKNNKGGQNIQNVQNVQKNEQGHAFQVGTLLKIKTFLRRNHLL
jgi:hypothetical protein